ncbi:tRNA-i(6)A37 methylthiotransferase [Candidatus Nasuia deltocephalinicola]|nr:tRNA-i(6)A37 methylthiotransferase [Candidatus Nasuia deltocephalinicola]
MKKFFHIKTFGCQMNFNDSLKISNILIKKGLRENKNLKKCDILIINTCYIRENCNNKLYKYIYKIYNKYNNLLFIITGCLSGFLANFLIKKFNFIKVILGTQGFYYIFNLIKMYYYYKCIQINIGFLKNNEYNIYNKNSSNINYLTIIEGCNKYCSYCIVPYTRGTEISIYLNIIIFKLLCLNNKYNILLLGQNVSSYKGKINDISVKTIKFYTLLNYIFQVYNIYNIFFISSHPQDFCDNLINNFKLNYKLSNLLHLPIQSFSNKILKLMRRNYNLNKIKYIIYNIKKIKKNIFISTDLIIGFCYEDNCDFYKTLVFIEKFMLDKSYIYIYSPRPYTKSYYFNFKISQIIKTKRFNLINYKIKNNFIYINKLMLGKIEFILIKNYFFYNNDIFIGLTNNNRILYFIFYNINYLYILKKYIKVKIIKIIYNIFYSEILSIYD